MEVKNFNIEEFNERSRNFRKEILEMLNKAGSGHSGGSLSCIDILNVLYFHKMKNKPEDPSWSERDRFIMSKGHASPAAYVALANRGYFPKEELKNFRKLGAILQGHVHSKVPGIELSTGSLGQGLAVANGIAIAGKLKNEDFNVYCLLGDGEIQEGSIWETLMAAGHRRLDNLCAILDYNKIQENGPVAEIKTLEPLPEKLTAFNWHVINIDGNDMSQIKDALDEFDGVKDSPTFIIANTIKGKGVSFMEGQAKWHGKAPDDGQLKEALQNLGF